MPGFALVCVVLLASTPDGPDEPDGPDGPVEVASRLIEKMRPSERPMAWARLGRLSSGRQRATLFARAGASPRNDVRAFISISSLDLDDALRVLGTLNPASPEAARVRASLGGRLRAAGRFAELDRQLAAHPPSVEALHLYLLRWSDRRLVRRIGRLPAKQQVPILRALLTRRRWEDVERRRRWFDAVVRWSRRLRLEDRVSIETALFKALVDTQENRRAVELLIASPGLRDSAQYKTGPNGRGRARGRPYPSALDTLWRRVGASRAEGSALRNRLSRVIDPPDDPQRTLQKAKRQTKAATRSIEALRQDVQQYHSSRIRFAVALHRIGRTDEAASVMAVARASARRASGDDRDEAFNAIADALIEMNQHVEAVAVINRISTRARRRSRLVALVTKEHRSANPATLSRLFASLERVTATSTSGACAGAHHDPSALSALATITKALMSRDQASSALDAMAAIKSERIRAFVGVEFGFAAIDSGRFALAERIAPLIGSSDVNPNCVRRNLGSRTLVLAHLAGAALSQGLRKRATDALDAVAPRQPDQWQHVANLLRYNSHLFVRNEMIATLLRTLARIPESLQHGLQARVARSLIAYDHIEAGLALGRDCTSADDRFSVALAALQHLRSLHLEATPEIVNAIERLDPNR